MNKELIDKTWSVLPAEFQWRSVEEELPKEDGEQHCLPLHCQA